MINWQTILSSFDDKPTLMQWLKIVEKELQNAENENKLFVHNLTLGKSNNETIKIRVISSLATTMSFEYICENFTNIIFVQRIVSPNILLVSLGYNISSHTLLINAWDLSNNAKANIEDIIKVNSDTVSELK